eukprot:6183236-Pleurochrysis_carterae.AAC.4
MAMYRPRDGLCIATVVSSWSLVAWQVRTELGTKGLPSSAHELRIRDLSGGQKVIRSCKKRI